MEIAKVVPELYCSDLARTLSFYVGILGFSVLYERVEERFAFLEREGAQIMVQEPLGRAFLTAELVYPFGRGIHLQVEVRDIAAVYDSVVRAGLPVFLPMEETWYRRNQTLLGQRQFGVQDPDGYLLRLFQSLGARPA
jgi:catechol 2,3-dioxygenase-like lactoylglutathione lyase family enzyme